VIDSKATASYNVLGAEYVIHLSGEHTAGELMVTETRLPPGSGVPMHVHTREDEVFYVTAGKVLFRVGEQEFTAERETTIFAPRNVPHSFQADAGGPAKMMVIIRPGSLEPMFRRLAELGAGPPNLERVAKIVADYGITFV
jgi:quercetin dioxygenase-like cupin family protein